MRFTTIVVKIADFECFLITFSSFWQYCKFSEHLAHVIYR
jgi:hypothetical protein